jgi:hypothetical protein
MSDVKVGQLWFGLGFDVDSVKLNDVVQAIGKLNLNSVLAAVGVGGLVEGLKGIMEAGSALTEPLYKFNTETGLSAQRMQQWSEYAQKFGVGADVVSSSLSGLQKKMAAMQFGDSSLLSGIYLLQQAGARISQADLNDPFSFLSKATEGLQKIKPELRTYVAGLLGLNDQLLLLKNFNGADAMPAPTPEQIASIRQFNSSWTELGIILKQLTVDAAATFGPMLDGIAKATEWTIKLIEKSTTLQGVLGGLAIAFGAFWVAALGPVGAAIFMLTSLLALIGQVTHYWPDLKKYASSGLGNIGASLASIAAPSSLITASGGRAISGGGVTQHNAITIIAHNISDLEHKFVAFMEKTIAKSFYQNSQNY